MSNVYVDDNKLEYTKEYECIKWECVFERPAEVIYRVGL